MFGRLGRSWLGGGSSGAQGGHMWVGGLYTRIVAQAKQCCEKSWPKQFWRVQCSAVYVKLQFPEQPLCGGDVTRECKLTE